MAARSGPQLQQPVFHQLAGLHVQRREGLVHEDDVGVERQDLVTFRTAV